MSKHPDYRIPSPPTPNSARCVCGGIRYWHATVEGGGCEDCECPEFTAAADRCPIHPSEGVRCFSCHLSTPCHDCGAYATHSGTSSFTGLAGRFCNEHTSPAHPAHALND